jgi:hypothetical protein
MFSYHAFLWLVMLEGKYIIESPPILNNSLETLQFMVDNSLNFSVSCFLNYFMHGVGGMVCLALDDD